MKLSNEITIDSAASAHVVNEVKLFESIEQIQGKHVKLPNSTVVTATGKGKVPVVVSGSGILLTNMYYIPDLQM